MEKIDVITGKCAYIPIANIDTDMIIPKQYLKTVRRTGLGQYLFAALRYNTDGSMVDNFILNKVNATILIAGDNFGCGSSREHAPWALSDYGISAIIAPSFADIFYNNCFKNGILPIKVEQKTIAILVESDADIVINLSEQTINYGHNACIYFPIEAHRKEVLLQGMDDITKVMQLSKEIARFEDQYLQQYPWMRGHDDA